MHPVILFSFLSVFGSDAGIYDRVVIQELIKTAAQMNQLDATSQKSFKGFHKILFQIMKSYLFLRYLRFLSISFLMLINLFVCFSKASKILLLSNKSFFHPLAHELNIELIVMEALAFFYSSQF